MARRRPEAGQESKAEALLRKTEAKIQARIDAGETEESGPLTVKRYAEDWLKRRTTHTVQDDEGRLKLHALPALKDLTLQEVRPRHIRELVRSLSQGELAPKTVRNVYGVLRTMFHDAQVEELIETSPCVLKRDDLPRKVDKNPTWRPTAIFTREEIQQLIEDGRIPQDRRVVYAVLALGGMRFGEAAALTWSAYDDKLAPLGKLIVAASYSVKKKAVKAVKTERPREVPVHLTLAAILADWRRSGWQQLMGRAPEAGDLILPSRLGDHRSVNHALKKTATASACGLGAFTICGERSSRSLAQMALAKTCWRLSRTVRAATLWTSTRPCPGRCSAKRSRS